MAKIALAIDIGASSGRHIIGRLENGEIKTEEVYRFPNGVKTENGTLVWDTAALLDHVKAGIDAALCKEPVIESLAIDTWGCDYVLLRGDKEQQCIAYRDKSAAAVVDRTHAIVPFETLYKKTGIQFQPFNTLYQLFRDKESGKLKGATDFLMLPEYLAYKLTGVKKKEYTNATTTGLINADAHNFDGEIIKKLGLPDELFTRLYMPGETVGEYKGVKVKLAPSHDTAAAVEGIPFGDGETAPYISSGTWSLLGIKTEKALTDARSLKGNWSNEGGVGYFRYQKNIMGMWVVNRLRDELCPGRDFSEIVKDAERRDYNESVDINADAFLAPESMKAAFDGALRGKNPPMCAADYFRLAYVSLARSYAAAIAELETNTGIKNTAPIYIVGGGAKNIFLNRLTEWACDRKVIALPIEASAIGNLRAQLIAK